MTPDLLDRVAQPLLVALADASVRALALAGVAGVLLFVMRMRRAAVRLQLWTIVLAAAMLMPVLERAMPSWPVPAPIPSTWFARTNTTSAAFAVPDRAIDSPHAVNPAPVATATAPSAPQQAVSQFTTVLPAAPPAPLPWRPSWLVIAAGIYLAGVAFLLLRMTIGWRTAARLVRHATPISDPGFVARLAAHSEAAGLPRPPHALETPALFVPMTIGVLRPVVVLPSGWTMWDATTLDAVLVHELAHIARRDAITQRLALFYRAVCWINPLPWWLHRHLVDLGEQASDDAALEAGADRAAYAGMLVEFFRAIKTRTGRVDWTVAMASGVSVERRVERILDWRESAKTRGRMALRFALMFLPVAVVAASAEPVPFRAHVPAAPQLASATTPVPGPSSAPAPIVPERVVRTHASTNITQAPATPQTTNEAARDGFRMAVLLFDLGSSRDTRQLAVDRVRRNLSLAQARWHAGVDPGRVWQIATVGNSVEVLQDFTGDFAKIEAALTRVVSAPQSQADVRTRLAGVEGWCDAVSHLPQGDIYFRDWPDRQVMQQIGTVSPGAPDSTYRALDYVVSAPSMISPQICRQTNLWFNIVPASTAPSTQVAPDASTQAAQQPAAPTVYYRMSLGRPMTLVFDPAALSGDDLTRALDLASKLVDQSGESTQLSVVTAGVAPRLLQDFTGDKTLLHAALDKVRTMDAGPDARTTVTSARGLCAQMYQRLTARQLIEGPAVFIGDAQLYYFSAAVERGQLPARDLFDVAAMCSDARVRFYVLDAPWISPVYTPRIAMQAPQGFREIGYSLGVGLSLVPRQPGSPVTLTETRSDLDGGFAFAVVRNDSQKPIRVVTVAALVQANDSTLSVPRIFTARGPVNFLDPDASFEMATRLIDGATLNALARQGARAELGVVEVEFADGSKWTYDLKAKGRFER